MTVTPDDIAKVLGSVDPTQAAKIASTGATRQELEDAWAWLQSPSGDDHASSAKPGGTVGRILDILSPPPSLPSR